MGCDYWTSVHTSAVRKIGLDDGGILEIMAVIDLFSGFSNLMKGLDTEKDENEWNGWG